MIIRKGTKAEEIQAQADLPIEAANALAAMPDFIRFMDENHEKIHAQYISGSLGPSAGFDWFTDPKGEK